VRQLGHPCVPSWARWQKLYRALKLPDDRRGCSRLSSVIPIHHFGYITCVLLGLDGADFEKGQRCAEYDQPDRGQVTRKNFSIANTMEGMTSTAGHDRMRAPFRLTEGNQQTSEPHRPCPVGFFLRPSTRPIREGRIGEWLTPFCAAPERNFRPYCRTLRGLSRDAIRGADYLVIT